MTKDDRRLSKKRWKVERARHGPKIVDAKVLVAALVAARRAGIQFAAIAERANISDQTLSDLVNNPCPRAKRTTVSAVIGSLHTLIMERNEAADDALASLNYMNGPGTLHRKARWPAEPLQQAVAACYGSVRQSPWFSQIYRLSTLSNDQAEFWAHRLELHPVEIWPDYNQDTRPVGAP